MLISMTGHGHATRPFESGCITAEVRAVNNRFLKVTARLDDAVSALEPEVESLVRSLVRRGSLSVSIGVSGGARTGQGSLDASVLESYLSAAQRAASKAGWHLPVGDFLALPGVFQNNSPADANVVEGEPPIVAAARGCLADALADLQTMRSREGQTMAKQFEQTFAEFAQMIDRIQTGSARQLNEYQARLEAKVRKSLEMLGTKFEPSDIIREVTLFADRADICEEIVRFRSHLQQMQELLYLDESPGRKMEFLIQELHREINTIGSKSYDAEIASSVVDVKAKIEQLRELVQNIE